MIFSLFFLENISVREFLSNPASQCCLLSGAGTDEGEKGVREKYMGHNWLEIIPRL